MPIIIPSNLTDPASGSEGTVGVPGVSNTPVPYNQSYQSIQSNIPTTIQAGVTSDVVNLALASSDLAVTSISQMNRASSTTEVQTIGTTTKVKSLLLGDPTGDGGGTGVPTAPTSPVGVGVDNSGPYIGSDGSPTGPGASGGSATIGVDSVNKLTGFQVFPFRPNHRYRGGREAKKFLLLVQKVFAAILNLRDYLLPTNTRLNTVEDSVYPTDTQVSQIQHCLVQTKFYESIRLKIQPSRWFN